ncbi:MAG: FtsX-like permease family protein [Bacteroidota bacterium]|jgi:putative ABC transport system permease protein
MIKFLFKGLLRDRSRSLFPVLTVTAGVILTVFLHAWINGAWTSVVKSTAHYSTGHVRVMTKAYSKEKDQQPNDLALLGIDTLMTQLRNTFPDMLWTPRITFGGLLDIPDSNKETRVQSPINGLGVDILSQGSPELKILNIKNAIVRGRSIQNRNEMLISEELAQKLGIQPGQTATLISSTMNGSMTTANFTIAGTVLFGVGAMDRGAVIADIADIQQMLDMQQGAGEILGFFPDDFYHEDRATILTSAFNNQYQNSSNQFAPIMAYLRSDSGLSDYLDLISLFSNIIMGVFLLAMSIVLWNAGLTGSLRRYGEMGVRLAIGEDTGHIYRSMIAESLMIGFAGSLIGTSIGLAFAYYMQVKGFNIGGMLKNNSIMIDNIIRAQITPVSYIIGFLPGMLATLFGTALSGIGIYKRQTSQLFKELET